MKITVDNDAGRALLALRAGEMTSGAITERLGSWGVVSALARAGLVEGDTGGWRLTAAGRAACPLRNPLAATVLKPPPPALTTTHPWRSLPPRLTPPIKEIAMTAAKSVSKPVETIAQATSRLVAANAALKAAHATTQAAAPAVAQDAAAVGDGLRHDAVRARAMRVQGVLQVQVHRTAIGIAPAQDRRAHAGCGAGRNDTPAAAD